MGLFGRQRGARRLPANIVELMEQFGRFEFDPRRAGNIDPGAVYEDIVGPLYQLSTSDAPGFVAELAAAVVPVGGWAVYGGERLVKELFTGDLDDPSYHAMMSAALDFLRSLGLPNSRLNSYEWSFWLEHKGRTEPWLVARPLPTPDQAPIRELGIGEERRVAQLDALADSNLIYVRRRREGGFEAFVDARRSDDDPARGQFPLYQSNSLHDLYRQIAESLQVPPYWCDREIEPYFPYPKPAIEWLPSR